MMRQEVQKVVDVEVIGVLQRVAGTYRYSDGSEDRFSAREVSTLRRWVVSKEKEERRKNIVIKGAKPEGELKIWIQRFIKKK